MGLAKKALALTAAKKGFEMFRRRRAGSATTARPAPAARRRTRPVR